VNFEPKVRDTAGESEPPAPSEQSRVGYARPPVATRFPKGVSGNPKGRPRGSMNVSTLLMATLREKVVINEGGLRKTVTKLEAALKQVVNKAASGDLKALSQLMGLAREAEERQKSEGSQPSTLKETDQKVIQGILQRFQSQLASTADGGTGANVKSE
jgi:hypothetical protein